MHRYVCKIGPLTLYSYGAMLALAFFLGALIAAHRAKRRGIAPSAVYDLVAYILVSSLIGARVFFVMMNLEYYRTSPLEVFKLWEGGLVLYGGIISGFCVAVWYMKRARLPVWKVADILAPGIALGIAIGRVGCFLNGCCYGRITQAGGVRYPAADMPPAYEQQLSAGLVTSGAGCSLPVLPTQLYETGACLVILAVLLIVEKKFRMFDGFLFWLFILLYAIQRFFLEGLRSYGPNFYIGAMTVSQVMSLVLAAVSAGAIASGLRSTKVNHESASGSK